MTAVRPDHSPDLAFVEVSAEDPRSVQLMAELQSVYVTAYGGEDESPIDAHEFDPPSGMFLVAQDSDGRIVGCIGVRHHKERVGEIKRMYVRPQYRRRGYARALLIAVEDRACELGYDSLVLETGTPQPDAIALYERHGYQPVPAFGYYEGAELSRFFGRAL